MSVYYTYIHIMLACRTTYLYNVQHFFAVGIVKENCAHKQINYHFGFQLYSYVILRGFS